MGNKIESIDHLGNRYPSRAKMCEAYKIKYSIFKDRIDHGWSLEDALTKPITTCSVKDHLGNVFPSQKALLAHYGISHDIYLKGLKENRPLEDILTGKIKVDYTVKDHLGNTFRSLNEMCAHYGISRQCYIYRIKSGMTIKEALTEKKSYSRNNQSGTTCEDHIGNKYDSIKELCDTYNISISDYRNRLQRGWSLEKILLTPHVSKEAYHQTTDHLGNTFPSIKALCQYYDISYDAYNKLKKQGKSVEEIIAICNNRKFIDHKGKEFASLYDMCAYYNITLSAYYQRKYKGMSLEQILTEKYHVNKGHGKETYDHLGNKYQSFEEMCLYYKQSPYTVRSRLKAGLSLRDALCNDVKDRFRVTDHLGQGFASTKEMCAAYNINPATYLERVRKGYSKEDALTKSQNYMQNIGRGKIIKDHLGNTYLSIKDMCAAYNISYNAFCKRKKKGWPLKDCLLSSEQGRKKARRETEEGIYDHLNNKYSSLDDMLKHYNLTRTQYRKRLRSGWNLKDTLTTPLQVHRSKNDYIGQTEDLISGLSATIIDFINSDDITVQYEDGHIEKHCKLENFQKKHTAPYKDQLDPYMKFKEYAGFTTKFVSREGNKSFYECECQKCKALYKDSKSRYRFVMTPQMMLEHEKMHFKKP